MGFPRVVKIKRSFPRRDDLVQGGGFTLVVIAATLFPLILGRVLWPTGLGYGMELMFWPASAVNVAGLLWLGWRFWPACFAGTLIGVLLVGRAFWPGVVNSFGNSLEALAAWWIIRGWGDFRGDLSRLRQVLALIAAAVIAPLASSLIGALNYAAGGVIPWSDYGAAAVVWTMANGSCILLLAPFLIALAGGHWSWSRWRGEVPLWLGVGLIGGVLAFDPVFRGGQANFAFVMFPFVTYAAVRLGPEETALALFVVLVAIYSALIRNADGLSAEQSRAAHWFVPVFCYALAATGLAGAALVCERREAQDEANAERRLALEATLRERSAELDALRYQINPHFLFNALTSLRATLPGGAESSREMVSALAEYLRFTLAPASSPEVPLREELRGIESYLAIERQRFGEALRAEIDVSAEAQDLAVPLFTLQPIVENAIRHGFERKTGDFLIRITAEITGGSTRVEIANTGEWAGRAGDGGRRGTGIENIRRRLALLHGSAAALHHEASDGWVRVWLEIPVRKGGRDELSDRG